MAGNSSKGGGGGGGGGAGSRGKDYNYDDPTASYMYRALVRASERGCVVTGPVAVFALSPFHESKYIRSISLHTPLDADFAETAAYVLGKDCTVNEASAYSRDGTVTITPYPESAGLAPLWTHKVFHNGWGVDLQHFCPAELRQQLKEFPSPKLVNTLDGFMAVHERGEATVKIEYPKAMYVADDEVGILPAPGSGPRTHKHQPPTKAGPVVTKIRARGTGGAPAPTAGTVSATPAPAAGKKVGLPPVPAPVPGPAPAKKGVSWSALVKGSEEPVPAPAPVPVECELFSEAAPAPVAPAPTAAVAPLGSSSPWPIPSDMSLLTGLSSAAGSVVYPTPPPSYFGHSGKTDTVKEFSDFFSEDKLWGPPTLWASFLMTPEWNPVVKVPVLPPWHQFAFDMKTMQHTVDCARAQFFSTDSRLGKTPLQTFLAAPPIYVGNFFTLVMFGHPAMNIEWVKPKLQ
jgi:hypothetical protein